MNKKIIILFFLLSLNFSQAQDSLAVAKDTTYTKWKEKDILIDTSAIEKRSFAKNFKEKYSNSDFVYEYEAAQPNLWQRFMLWLLNTLGRLLSLSNPATTYNVLKWIAAIVILFVIYLITKALIRKEGSWIFGNNGNKKISHQDIEKNIHLIDFEKLIQENLQQNKKRLCIRYYYLWLLKVMTENRLIEWHADKTNTDYLYEIHSKSVRDEFSYLSYLYNYIWYGEFEMDENSFLNAQNRFKNALKSFGNE